MDRMFGHSHDPLPASTQDRYPRWSPDGESIAFRFEAMVCGDDIFVVSTRGGEPRPLHPQSERHDERLRLASGQLRHHLRLESWIDTTRVPPWGLWEMPLAGKGPAER